MEPLKYDYNMRLTTFTVITLCGFYYTQSFCHYSLDWCFQYSRFCESFVVQNFQVED